MRYVFIIGSFLLAASIQLLVGNFPLSFMVFPLNVVFAVAWLFLLWRLYKENRTSGLMRFLLAPSTTILSIFLLIGGGLVIGLFPQLSDAEAAAREGIVAALGCYNFMSSWIFIAILGLFLSHLAVITLRVVYRRKPLCWHFLLNHVGLWLALFAGFVGSSDTQTWRMPVHKGEPTREAFDINGNVHYVDAEIELRSFAVDYYPNGQPSRFAATIRVGEEEAVLRVNHPYASGWGEDIYLTGYEVERGNESRYCILQVVYQPWKYAIAAGIWMMLAGAVLLFIKGPKKR